MGTDSWFANVRTLVAASAECIDTCVPGSAHPAVYCVMLGSWWFCESPSCLLSSYSIFSDMHDMCMSLLRSDHTPESRVPFMLIHNSISTMVDASKVCGFFCNPGFTLSICYTPHQSPELVHMSSIAEMLVSHPKCNWNCGILFSFMFFSLCDMIPAIL